MTSQGILQEWGMLTLLASAKATILSAAIYANMHGLDNVPATVIHSAECNEVKVYQTNFYRYHRSGLEFINSYDNKPIFLKSGDFMVIEK